MGELPGVATAAPNSDRFEILDALRGFALLGVLLANILSFCGWYDLSQDQRVAFTGENGVMVWSFLHHAFLEGRFYSLFSLMFGIGFAVILARLSRRDASEALTIYRRRLWVLLGIGLVHLCLIWAGDILVLYSLLGFVLVACRNLSDRALLIGAATLVLFPILGYALTWATQIQLDMPFYDLGMYLDQALSPERYTLQSLERLRLEGWAAFMEWTLPGPPFRVGDLLQSWRLPKVMGIFLLGLWAGRRLVAGTLLNDHGLLIRVCKSGLLVGLPAGILLGLMPEQRGGPQSMDGLQVTVLYAFAVVPMALAYASGFVLLWQAGGERLLRHFAPVGRMALTNYLSQTIICITIFYGIGFGMIGRFAPWQVVATALAIYTGQWLFSRWWLGRYAFGPMEWLWRSLSYRRRMPMLRSTAA
jgi:uncharacterized protein